DLDRRRFWRAGSVHDALCRPVVVEREGKARRRAGGLLVFQHPGWRGADCLRRSSQRPGLHLRSGLGADHLFPQSAPAFQGQGPRCGFLSMNLAVDAPQAALFEPVARIYGEPLAQMPLDLYIPPDALAVMLDAFEGPLDLLLYMIRRANIDILDIPMAPLTRQYLDYVEAMRTTNLELAADYLVMAAMLIEIKSRMLLPRHKVGEGDE